MIAMLETVYIFSTAQVTGRGQKAFQNINALFDRSI